MKRLITTLVLLLTVCCSIDAQVIKMLEDKPRLSLKDAVGEGRINLSYVNTEKDTLYSLYLKTDNRYSDIKVFNLNYGKEETLKTLNGIYEAMSLESDFSFTDIEGEKFIFIAGDDQLFYMSWEFKVGALLISQEEIKKMIDWISSLTNDRSKRKTIRYNGSGTTEIYYDANESDTVFCLLISTSNQYDKPVVVKLGNAKNEVLKMLANTKATMNNGENFIYSDLDDNKYRFKKTSAKDYMLIWENQHGTVYLNTKDINSMMVWLKNQ